MTPLIIGFGHKARHGKDTICNFVHAALPNETKIMGFSDDLKAFARVLGMRAKDARLLQALGTDVFRRLDQDFWLRCMGDRIAETDAACVLIPDVRFENEARWIYEQDGLLVRVSRTDPGTGLLYTSADRDPMHHSETDLDHYDKWGWFISKDSGDMRGLEAEAAYLAKAIATRIGGIE